METTHSCSQAVDFLLAEIVPPTGAAILLLRHPVGSVFFSNGLGPWPQLPWVPRQDSESVLPLFDIYQKRSRTRSAPWINPPPPKILSYMASWPWLCSTEAQYRCKPISVTRVTKLLFAHSIRSTRMLQPLPSPPPISEVPLPLASTPGNSLPKQASRSIAMNPLMLLTSSRHLHRMRIYRHPTSPFCLPRRNTEQEAKGRWPLATGVLTR